MASAVEKDDFDDLFSGVVALTDDPIVSEARSNFDRGMEWEGTSRNRFMEDLRFRNGDSDNGYQWPNTLKQGRDNDNKPSLTMNIIRQHNLIIANEMRKNKSSIKFIATGGQSTQESASIVRDIERRIEYQSRAQSAFTMARNFMVDAGIGWWRLKTDYASNDTFDQEIYIGIVPDPMSIIIDPDCKEHDKSDAEWGLVFDMVPRKKFRQAHPKYVDLMRDAPLGIGILPERGKPKDNVWVCEYFRKERTKDTLVSFVHLGERKTLRKSMMPKGVYAALKDDPLTKTRSTETVKVMWYLIVGNTVIDKTEWPGKYIPLIPCIGEETVIDGIMDRKGHTRAMKDAQRMFNYNAALDINTRIPTPTGWTTMGLLKAGDWIFDHKGSPVEVAKALPIKYGEKCFEVKFDNGHSIVTDEGHIWQVEERGKRKSAGEQWSMQTRATGELESGKHFVYSAEPLDTAELDLSINPYALGVWLGDGHSASGRVSCHLEDGEEQKHLFEELGYTTGDLGGFQGNGGCFTVFGLRGQLVEADLLGDKHIPRKYLRASYQQRLALLQGLMDTDGHFAKATNTCIFTNGNVDIIRGFMELCSTLGLKATLSAQPRAMKEFPSGKTYESKTTYRVQFAADPEMQIFRLERKAKYQQKDRPTTARRTKRLGIVSVLPVESRPVRCITLDTPEHLYLCGDGMIPTHNSAQVEFGALQTKVPWLAALKAIEELEQYWNTANTTNHSVLPYNAFDDEGNPIPPPTRPDPPQASPAFQTGMDTAFQQLMMTSGQWQNQMGMAGNERTGAAIGKRQEQGETSTYHFADNFEEALVNTGRQILDLIPKIYDTKRIIKIIAEDGTDYELTIDPTARDAYLEEQDRNNQAVKKIFNPSLGEYDVASSVGPEYGSKREETVEAFTMILAQNPGLTGIIGDLLLSTMEFDKAQEAAQRLKRMVPQQALGNGPTQQEQILTQQVQSLTELLGKSMEEQAKMKIKLVGKDQKRDIDVFEAETNRMKALQDFLPLDPEGLKQMVQQIVGESSNTTLDPIISANADSIDPQGQGEEPGEQFHPALGVSKAPDGEWYMTDPTRRGKYLRLAPLAQMHKPGGVR